MAMLDKLAEFCDATDLNTGGAGTYTIGSQIDTSQVTSYIGEGEPVYLVVSVALTATSGGSATATFLLVTDDAVALSSGTTLATSPTWAVASMTATTTATPPRGTILWCIALPSNAQYLQHLGIRQTTATAAFTAGKVDAYLTKDPSIYRAYANAI